MNNFLYPSELCDIGYIVNADFFVYCLEKTLSFVPGANYKSAQSLFKTLQ